MKELIEAINSNNLAEANRLIEQILLQKISQKLEEKKREISVLEGEIKINNKKKKNRLEVRTGRSVGAVNFKHVGRNILRTADPEKLKAILAT